MALTYIEATTQYTKYHWRTTLFSGQYELFLKYKAAVTENKWEQKMWHDYLYEPINSGSLKHIKSKFKCRLTDHPTIKSQWVFVLNRTGSPKLITKYTLNPRRLLRRVDKNRNSTKIQFTVVSLTLSFFWGGGGGWVCLCHTQGCK